METYTLLCAAITAGVVKLEAHQDPEVKATAEMLGLNIKGLNDGWTSLQKKTQASKEAAVIEARKSEVREQEALWAKLKMTKENDKLKAEHRQASQNDVKKVRSILMKYLSEVDITNEETKQRLELHYYEYKDRSTASLQSKNEALTMKISKLRKSSNEVFETVPTLLVEQFSVQHLLKEREKNDAAKLKAQVLKLKLKKKQQQLQDKIKRADLSLKMQALGGNPHGQIEHKYDDEELAQAASAINMGEEERSGDDDEYRRDDSDDDFYPPKVSLHSFQSPHTHTHRPAPSKPPASPPRTLSSARNIPATSLVMGLNLRFFLSCFCLIYASLCLTHSYTGSLFSQSVRRLLRGLSFCFIFRLSLFC